MSHELRTPLNAMLGFAQLLASTRPSRCRHSNAPTSTTSRRPAGTCFAMIDEVLDLARIESGRMALAIEPRRAAGE